MRIGSFLALVCLFACGRSSLISRSPSPASPGPGAGVPDVVALHITPPSVTLPPNGTQQFSADRSVTWTVIEPNGGTIDSSGNYSAPPTPGNFTVAASAIDGSGLTATAAVTVRPWRLELLAGMLDGAGYADDRGANARFAQPQHLAFDGAGTLYIADAGNHAVRKLVVATGTVTTLATGKALVDAHGIAFDGRANLYVTSDQTLVRVRIDSGTVETIAGTYGVVGARNGVAADATFSFPSGLAWDDGRQRLYIADSSSAVRIYDPHEGSISTLVTTSTRMDGLAFDGVKQLYIFNANGVARVDVTQPYLSVSDFVFLAGGNTYGVNDGVSIAAHFSGELGQLALDVSANALYIADANVRRLDLATQRVTTVGQRDLRWGGNGLALDGAGGLFVSSSVVNAIAHEQADGSARTIIAGPPPAPAYGAAYVDASGAAARFAKPKGIVSDGNGALFVADKDNNVVRRVDIKSGAVTTFAGNAYGFDRDGAGNAGAIALPTHVTSDGSGGYVIVESDTVRRWSPATSSVTTLAGKEGLYGNDDGPGAQALFNVAGGACVLDGAVYVADEYNATLRKIDLATGMVSTVAGSPEQHGDGDGIGAQARFGRPVDVVCDVGGSVYVLDGGNGTNGGNNDIRRVDLASGRVTHFFSGLTNVPMGMTRDASYLYIHNEASQPVSLQRVRLADAKSDTIAGPTDAAVLVSLATDGAGKLYTTSRFGGLYSITTAGVITPLANTGPNSYFGEQDGPLYQATFGADVDMTWDAGGLVLAELSFYKLRRVDFTTNSVRTFVGPPGVLPNGGLAGNGWLSWPTALARDGGRLYVGAWSLVGVDIASADMNVLADNSTGNAIGEVGGLVSDGKGAIYIADLQSSLIRRYDIADGSLQVIAGNPEQRGSSDGIGGAATFYNPAGVVLDGGTLYIADSQNHTIRALRLPDGNVTTFAGMAGMSGTSDGVGGAARFNTPLGLAGDGQGHMFVADSGNGLIRRVDLASGSVTTVVGVAGQRGVLTGSLPARLNNPRGVAVLGGGSLAITDEQAVLILR
jgi:sugar lactone lactonase YvrE